MRWSSVLVTGGRTSNLPKLNCDIETYSFPYHVSNIELLLLLSLSLSVVNYFCKKAPFFSQVLFILCYRVKMLEWILNTPQQQMSSWEFSKQLFLRTFATNCPYLFLLHLHSFSKFVPNHTFKFSFPTF